MKSIVIFNTCIGWNIENNARVYIEKNTGYRGIRQKRSKMIMPSNTNSAISLFLSRRSIRKYHDKDIPSDIVEALLKAAMSAPSARATDPWRFIIVKEASTRAEIAKGLPNGAMLEQAPLGIVICGEIAKACDSQISYMLQDCSAAIENILLAAHALGLGACWLGVHPKEERMAHIVKTLNLPQGIIPVSCIAIGYPAESKEARTRYNTEFVHYEKW
jgi:nitroreductase